MKDTPLVTIYVPTYNRMNLLRRAVESVLNQDYKNIELIVVDDGSSDGTVEYLKELTDKESRVRYFVNEENSGACVSRNRAIFSANGEFITGLDDDDYFLPARISDFVSDWREDATTKAIFTDSVIIHKGGVKRRTWRPRKVTRIDLGRKNFVGNQIFIRTRSLHEIGGFTSDMPLLQDFECWLRLINGEGAHFRKIGTPSYVLDVSHSHERISSGNFNRRHDALQRIYERGLLSGEEVDSILLNKDVYIGGELKFSRFIADARGNPRPHNIIRLIRLFVLSTVARLKRRRI